VATIRKRYGRWRVQIRKRGHKAQFKSFAQKSEAFAWARQVESEMDRGMFVSRAEAERTTLGELFDRYERDITPCKASARREAQRLRQLRNEFGHRYVAQLRSQEIASYRDQRLACGLAGATVAKELATLAHVIDTGRREWGIHLPENPVRLVKRPRIAPGRDRRLLAGEEDKLLAACHASRSSALPVLVRLAVETAMRLGELLALEWRHVDLDRRVAFLPHTKNGQSRSVPLSPAAVALLTSWPRSLNGRVFPHWGRSDSVENVWRRAVARAGLEDLRFHDLRHEGTSRLFERGLNPMQVAAITGHRTLQMLKRYTHLRAEDLAVLLHPRQAA
jgi:integrase